MTETTHKWSPAHLRYAQVMDQCRDMALVFSNTQISELFEHAGAALLDFAERAQNNKIQGQFFEAMNLIQRRRTDIEHTFREEVKDGFDNFGKLDPPSFGRDSNDPEAQDAELSLLAPDEMEESVATENLVVKANAAFFPELFALSQRLAVVNDGKKLKDYEIPAGPHRLVHSFRHSIASLEIEVRIKIILYALFDKFVVKQAKSLYDELNGSLKGAGILPNLKPVHIRPEQGQSQDPQTAEEQAENEEQEAAPEGSAARPGSQSPPSLGAELFDSIIDLMSNRRTGPGAAPRKGPSGPVMPSSQVVSAINQIQAQSPPQSVSTMMNEVAQIPNLEVDTAFVERVKQTLTQERAQIFEKVDKDKLSPMDVDLIDLIGMLFEYMLNDPVLPNLAKALLSHLHTPYLKVALIDRRLLVDEGHPSRRLLDQLVEAGSLWVDENNPKRGIFPAMQQIVDRVLQEFTDDVSLFDALLSDLEHAMAEQRRKTDTMEHRTQKAARGREKLQLAKQRATHQVQILEAKGPLPGAVSEFLRQTWIDHLVFILLRDKDEDRGEPWKQAVGVAEELIALFDPEAEATAKQARLAALPQLRERITEGIKRMGAYPHTTLDPLFALLEKPDTWEEKRREIAAQQQQAAAAAAAAPGAKTAPAAPSQKDAQRREESISQQEQEVIQRLRKMKFGTWFEFKAEPGGTPRRIKLSWLSSLTSTCMFVDRSGIQAEIKTLHELAREILSGRAKVIPRPKHPFIERAMVSIRKMLQGQEEAPAGAPTKAPTGAPPTQ